VGAKPATGARLGSGAEERTSELARWWFDRLCAANWAKLVGWLGWEPSTGGSPARPRCAPRSGNAAAPRVTNSAPASTAAATCRDEREGVGLEQELVEVR
jgi:hypothetical protein